MSFTRAQALADAVLLEGYVLYPYRASSTKNRFRWTFGVLAPERWSEAGGCEPWWFQSSCLWLPRGKAEVKARLRFIQVQRRTVEAWDEAAGAFRPVERLEVEGVLHLPWEEGHVCEQDVDLPAPDDGAQSRTVSIRIPAHRAQEELRDASGRLHGRIVRERWPLEGQVRMRLEAVGARLPEPQRVVRIDVRVENVGDAVAPGAARDEALRRAFVAAHLLLWAPDGGLVSMTDPPAGLDEAANACENVRTWPVLVGAPGSSDLVLSAPIILYDYAQLAPESPGDFFDATEIDELLTLRTATLTPEEKRQARATDPRAAALLDRVEALPPERRAQLHGTLRALHRNEMVPRFVPPAPEPGAPRPRYERGTKVRLRPGRRRTDAQDLLFAGCLATVEAVMRDVDGREYLAVTLDDDPAKDLNRWYGRFQYYQLDEVEPP